MRRKRRQVVVTVTETWTFVIDETGETPELTPPLDMTELASIPTPLMGVVTPAADVSANDAQVSDSELAQGG